MASDFFRDMTQIIITIADFCIFTFKTQIKRKEKKHVNKSKIIAAFNWICCAGVDLNNSREQLPQTVKLMASPFVTFFCTAGGLKTFCSKQTSASVTTEKVKRFKRLLLLGVWRFRELAVVLCFIGTADGKRAGKETAIGLDSSAGRCYGDENTRSADLIGYVRRIWGRLLQLKYIRWSFVFYHQGKDGKVWGHSLVLLIKG